MRTPCVRSILRVPKKRVRLGKKEGGSDVAQSCKMSQKYHTKLPTYLNPTRGRRFARLRGSVPIKEFEVGILDILSGFRRYPLPMERRIRFVKAIIGSSQEVTVTIRVHLPVIVKVKVILVVVPVTIDCPSNYTPHQFTHRFAWVVLTMENGLVGSGRYDWRTARTTSWTGRNLTVTSSSHHIFEYFFTARYSESLSSHRRQIFSLSNPSSLLFKLQAFRFRSYYG
jgi:hypothetical protein